MGNLDPRVTRAAGIYFGLIVLIVIAAQLGVVPGTFDRPLLDGGGPSTHPYQLAMRATVLLLAVALGVNAALATTSLFFNTVSLHFNIPWSFKSITSPTSA